MPQSYSPTGQVGTSVTEATVAEAATGTHGQTFMKDNLEVIANKIRFLQDSGQFSPANLLDLTNAAAGQIGFPASQNASAGANVLDDYEEGTFVPTISGITSATYSAQAGFYTKIGRLVVFQSSVHVSGGTRNGSQVAVSGLPFTSSSADRYGAFNAFLSGIIAAGSTVLFSVEPSSTAIGLYDTNGVAIVGTSLTTATPDMRLAGFYHV